MNRKLEQELDALQAQIDALRERLTQPESPAPAVPDDLTDYEKYIMSSLEREDPLLAATVLRMEKSLMRDGQNGELRSGAMATVGYFRNIETLDSRIVSDLPDDDSVTAFSYCHHWIDETQNTDELLGLIENRVAADLLQCLGSNDRWRLLLAILRSPMSVAEIVEKCGFNTTGQAYHHLEQLVTSGVVTERETVKGRRSVYEVDARRMPGLLAILSGVASLLKPGE
jgi:hypothetical protein